MNNIINSIRPAASVFLMLTAITGIAYPLLTTAVAQVAFADAANGSIVTVGGKAVGSSLIGQAFSGNRYFWSRPSATSPMANNGIASGGSNQGSNNPALLDAVKGRIDALRAADPANRKPVPVDLVTASASGLDPQISLAAALYQAPRVARERKLGVDAINALIERHAERPFLGLVGEPMVNVLALNLALDAPAAAR